MHTDSLKREEEERFIHGHPEIYVELAVSSWVFSSGRLFVPLNNYIKCLTSLLLKDIKTKCYAILYLFNL